MSSRFDNLNNKKIKLASIFKTQFTNLSRKLTKSQIFSEEKAYSNELYTSPVVLFKSIFTESNYSSDDYAESKNRQLSFTDSYLDKKASYHNLIYPNQVKTCIRRASNLNIPTIQSNCINNIDLSKTNSSMYRFSRQESLFNISNSNNSNNNNNNTFSINEKMFAVTQDVEAKCPGDLDLRFSERVKLIHYNNDYSLVETLSGVRGYCPSHNLINLSVFLNISIE
jgi:hypothetical protein